MDKLIFLFRRKPGMTRAAYHDHYENSHRHLGMRLTLGMDGYTVNLVQSDDTEFDAITEIWTPSVEEFFDIDKAFRRPEDAQVMIDDHLSFMGPQDAFLVEESVVRDGALDAPELDPSPWAKQISLHAAGEALPEPPADTFRVVDHRVVRAILLGDQPVDGSVKGWEAPPGTEGPPPSTVGVLRMVWADDAAALPATGARTVAVRELRNKVLA